MISWIRPICVRRSKPPTSAVPEVGGYSPVSLAIVDVLRACEDWDGLREHVAALTKRRAQLKQAIAAMVRRCMTFIDDAPDGEQRLKLIETLCDATSGKIFVEVEKSRLTRALARMHEEAGRIDEACGVMQEVAIETYGALTRHEKLFFIEDRCGCVWRRRITSAR